jgi:hypothetical protein
VTEKCHEGFRYDLNGHIGPLEDSRIGVPCEITGRILGKPQCFADRFHILVDGFNRLINPTILFQWGGILRFHYLEYELIWLPFLVSPSLNDLEHVRMQKYVNEPLVANRFSLGFCPDKMEFICKRPTNTVLFT